MAKLPRLITCLMWVFLVIFLVCGCDSIIGVESEDASTSSYVALNTDSNYVGLTKCYSCHGDAHNYTGRSNVFGESDELKNDGEGWLTGAHGNDESIDEVNNWLIDLAANTGFPYYGYSDLGTDTTCTTICHDSLGDGELFASFYLQTGIDSLGKVNRPVIGCESCHGAGETHGSIIVGSLPYPNPDASRCGQCHNDNFPEFHFGTHLGGERFEGDRIYEDYLSAPHTESVNSHVYVRGSTTEIRVKCARCHTDEGARQYISVVNGLATYDEIGTAMSDYADIDVNDVSNVQCRTCHDKHYPLKLLGERATGLPATWSNEFKTCTSCHQLLKADDTLLTEAYHDPDVNSRGNVNYIITDTHYDDPTTTDIEGYIVDPASTHSSSSGNTNSGTCRDCHNSHDADNTINIQWTKSAHGGHIYEVKEADPDGAVTATDAPGWADRNFRTYAGGGCAYCHTATGFRNFANDPAAYVAGNNVFVATDDQREMLYCWACHIVNMGNAANTSNPDGLRNPGTFSGTAAYSVPATRIAAVPDLEGSNICLVCHSGRHTGEEIKGAALTTSFNSFNPHYTPVGGILFRTIGYEYTGMDYDNKSYFKHDLCGTESAEGTGTSGPCVSCHMMTSEPHLFLPVTKDISDQVTEITAQDQCDTCHTNLTTAVMNEEKAGFENALEALKAQLETNGIYYGTSRPYFFDNVGDDMGPDTPWPDEGTIGAAFNYFVLGHEPGAYAHNKYYAERLIFDSIDFLDNGTMDGSIDLSSYAAAAEWYR